MQVQYGLMIIVLLGILFQKSDVPLSNVEAGRY